MFEKRNNLYFYPTYYEGFECSKNVVYTGAVPNQQLSNFIPWIIKNLGKKKFFIVGSNYIYPREMAKVCEDPDRAERRRVDRRRISRARPFRVGLDGQQDQELGLRRRCSRTWSATRSSPSIASSRTRASRHDKLPICATVTSEIEIAAMGAEYAVGSYTSFPYFQAIDTDINKAFVERYRKFVNDPKAVTHHALESSYFQVFLWKQAVEKASGDHADRHPRRREGTGIRRAERPRQDRAGKPAHLADAAHRAVAVRTARARSSTSTRRRSSRCPTSPMARPTTICSAPSKGSTPPSSRRPDAEPGMRPPPLRRRPAT